MNLAVFVYGIIKAAVIPHPLAINENHHIRAQVALFIEDIALQTRMGVKGILQCAAQILRRAVYLGGGGKPLQLRGEQQARHASAQATVGGQIADQAHRFQVGFQIGGAAEVVIHLVGRIGGSIICILINEAHKQTACCRFFDLHRHHRRRNFLLGRHFDADQMAGMQMHAVFNQQLAKIAYARDGAFAIASNINEYIAAGDWTLFYTLEEAYKKVTAADVKRVANHYLQEDQSTTGWFVPLIPVAAK